VWRGVAWRAGGVASVAWRGVAWRGVRGVRGVACRVAGVRRGRGVA
jgi:hypothetical protein